MAIKKVQYKQSTSLFLASVSLLVFGTGSLIANGGITYSSLIASAYVVVPAVGIMYCLGWLIGLVMESSKSVKKSNLGYANALLEEIMKEEGLDLDTNSSDEDDMPSDTMIDGIETESKE